MIETILFRGPQASDATAYRRPGAYPRLYAVSPFRRHSATNFVAGLRRGRRGQTLSGLGDGYTTAAQVTQVGGAVAGAVVTATAGSTAAAAAGAGAATAAASTAAIAVPIIGAAVLAVTLVLLAISKRNAQKTLATSIVNEVEPQLRANRDGYLAGPRTRSSQAQALANFDAGWNMVLQNCGRDDLGSAGRRCISERDRGGVWDWVAGYRDPIAADTPISDPILSAAAELFPDMTPAQRANVPKYAALAALAIGAALL